MIFSRLRRRYRLWERRHVWWNVNQAPSVQKARREYWRYTIEAAQRAEAWRLDEKGRAWAIAKDRIHRRLEEWGV